MNIPLAIEEFEKKLKYERVEHLRSVLHNRTLGIIPILESIFDQGNINAVIRTAENLGILEVQIVQSDQMKKSHRITRGCEKWMDIIKKDNIHDVVGRLKARGYKIVGTAFGENSTSLENFDASNKTAIIFGNEHNGISSQAHEICDEIVHIPSYGLSQSYNISVAAGIVLYNCIKQQRDKDFHQYALSGDQFDAKLLQWYKNN